MSVELQRRQFTVKEYHKMVETGILTKYDKVELIAGEIIKVAPIGIYHAACLRRLNMIFNQLLYSQVIVDNHNQIHLSNDSAPEPDLALLQWRDDFYEAKHPQPEDIFLLIEVADSTIKYDREIKMPLYAENGIHEVWLIDINQQLVEVYRQAEENSYQNVQHFFRGDILTIEFFNDFYLAVDEILG